MNFSYIKLQFYITEVFSVCSAQLKYNICNKLNLRPAPVISRKTTSCVLNVWQIAAMFAHVVCKEWQKALAGAVYIRTVWSSSKHKNDCIQMITDKVSYFMVVMRHCDLGLGRSRISPYGHKPIDLETPSK